MGWRFVNPSMRARYGVDTMPETAEHLAAEHGIARADQDAFACRSQQRAAAASREGFFANEIAPVTITGRKGTTIEVAGDEHPRPETTLEGLARLAPILGPGGTVTAGNASGVNDGAAALLVASEAAAARHGLTPLARVVSSAVAGVAPRVMGIGPVPATRKVLARTGLTLADLDVIELNEAFAAQALAVTRALGLPDDAPHVNPNGGAIAIGHPLGASGARITATLVNAMAQNGARYGLPTALHCAGSPIAFMANVHCAAAIPSFVSLEHHGLDLPFWESLVTGLPANYMADGYVTVPDKPGLGVTVNLDRVDDLTVRSEVLA